ncbi:PEP-CTERM sorting domain-containing protein [Polymorphobacter arshaanensis]|uniref:PEP-CTERM sorting domain-containing protein n=1 Tax=Glacieibacterium arshaanense TaxID=2511025 RepID=A0A4Y9EPA0_9SPHN|nr:PEP-CTERM sorting domain-containing protein [Polymorphobacter arshaanensis]
MIDPYSGGANLPLPWPSGGLAQGTKYRVSIQFSRPAIFFNVSYIENLSFLYCEYRTGWCGGDDYDLYYNVGALNTDSVSGTFTTGKNSYSRSVDRWGNVTTFEEWYRYVNGYFDNQFDGSDPVGYRIALQSVPEPASWAMMITGFGMIGGSLRTRRRALAG